MSTNIIDELLWRDAINQQTDAEGLRDYVENNKISLYCGVDPTGDSMHIGHLIPFMMLKRFQLLGHHPYILIGGADQWGNITAGLDLIRKKEGAEAKAFGLTIPLMLKADGTKFGKTAGGAIWLDPEKTSPYEFYQFWLNQDDRDVVRYLKFFTFLTQEEIEDLAKKVETEPHKREAQKTLAREMTLFVHGKEALADALTITEALFSGDVKQLTAHQIEDGFKNMPNVTAKKEATNIVDWLVETAIEPSKRQAREDVENGAISINGDKVTDTSIEINPASAINETFMIVRKGKKNYTLVTFK